MGLAYGDLVAPVGKGAQPTVKDGRECVSRMRGLQVVSDAGEVAGP